MDPRQNDVQRTFLYRYNAYCRLISGDCRGLEAILARLAYWTAFVPLKVCTASIMVMIALALGLGKNVSDFCDVGINFVSFLTIETYAFLFIIRGKQFSSIVKRLASLWMETKKDVRTQAELDVVKRCEKFVRLSVPVLNSGAFAIMIGYATAPVILFFTSGTKHKKMGLPFKMVLLFDVPADEIIYVYIVTVICLSYACFLIININALYLSTFQTLEAGFLLNGLHFGRAYESRWAYRLGFADNTVKKRLNGEFKKILIQHQQWLRAASELKEVMNARFLVLHIGTMSVTTLGAFLAANDPAHHYYQIAMASIPLSIYFLFFYLSTNVYIASESTANLIYFQHMTTPAPARIDHKTISLIMRQSHKPILFEIGKFWHLSLLKFVALLQHIFSTIMLLRTISKMDPQINNTIETA